MDQDLQALSLQLGEAAIRNTATEVAGRIRAVKARKQNAEIVAELTQLVTDLQADRNELVQIAQAFEETLVAQRLGDDEVRYVTTNIVPVLKKLLEFGANETGAGQAETQEMLDIIQPILSVETVTVLQLVGFNFKQAVGEPLTELVRRLILSKAQLDPDVTNEVQLLGARQQVAYWQALANPEVAAALSGVQPDDGESQTST